MPRPSWTAATMLAKLSSVRIMSEASRVTSVPVCPMAMPMCGFPQGGRVVHAVSRHRDDVAARLPFPHDAELVLGSGPGMDDLGGIVGGRQDAQLAADRLRRRPVVSGDHDRPDARGPCESDGRDGLGARRIGDADESQQLEVRLSRTLPHGDRQDAEALPRHVRVGFRRRSRCRTRRRGGRPRRLPSRRACRRRAGWTCAWCPHRTARPPPAGARSRWPCDRCRAGRRP